jgi:hypothetical protein
MSFAAVANNFVDAVNQSQSQSHAKATLKPSAAAKEKMTLAQRRLPVVGRVEAEQQCDGVLSAACRNSSVDNQDRM